MKQKLLYVLPHCSTGGMPAYVLKQIQTYLPDHEIKAVEVNNLSDEYVVHKERIANLCPLTQLYGRPSKLIEVVERFQPDIISFQEIPETFLPAGVIHALFHPNRTHFNVVQAHSSKSDFSLLTHAPDRFVAVNNWQLREFKAYLASEAVVWEYPIENKTVDAYTKQEARTALGFSSCQRMVINVGLFTPGKNQAELMRKARAWPAYTFHFVGNTADNFKAYWEPLLKDLPSNCYVHGERPDVDLFYKAADFMWFTSTDELNPIVVKEALGWNLPIFMRRLPTYGGDYDNNPLVTFYQ